MKDATALVDRITVEDRFRTDLGDIAVLADSIHDRGLINPITVTSDLRLIAGQRRLEAVRKLGWREVDVRVADDVGSAAELVRLERDENTCRKDMTASEQYALGARLTDLERPAAAERQAAAGARNLGVDASCAPKIPTSGERARTSEVVAPAVGMSNANWKRLKHIGDRATDGDPGAIDALDQIDQGKASISGAYRELKKTKPPAVDVKTKTHRGRKAAEGGRRLIEMAIGLASPFDNLDAIEIAPTAEEAAQWERDLGAASSAINRFRKQLREEA